MASGRLLLVLCLCGPGLLARASSTEEDMAALVQYEKCEILQSQEIIRMKLITGTWYVIEILHHRTDEKTYGRDLIEVTTCPTITLKYPAESDTELKLYWNEDEGDVDYRFRINETTSPGKWESAGAQTGILTQLNKYVQFAGTVFVRKAVSDHMVLTFCSPNRQLYSLVVSRNKTLDDKDLKSIKSQMKRIKLPVTQTKLACRNSSPASRAAVWLLIAATCLMTHRAGFRFVK